MLPRLVRSPFPCVASALHVLRSSVDMLFRASPSPLAAGRIGHPIACHGTSDAFLRPSLPGSPTRAPAKHSESPHVSDSDEIGRSRSHGAANPSSSTKIVVPVLSTPALIAGAGAVSIAEPADVHDSGDTQHGTAVQETAACASRRRGSTLASELAADVMSAIDRMVGTVNDVLDFRKLDAGMFQMNCKPATLALLISSACRHCRSFLPTTVEFGFRVTPPEAEVVVDSRRVFQIITNGLR
jgi:hypothetical protein